MINLIHVDLFSLRRIKVIKVLFVIMLLAALSMVLVSYLAAAGYIGRELPGYVTGLTDMMAMSITGPLAAGVFICSDFENKTIQAAVSCGFGRGTLIVSKSISLFLVIIVFLLPYSIITAIAFSTGYAFGAPYAPSVYLGILSNAPYMAFTAQVLSKMIIVMLILMVVYAAKMSILVLLAFSVRKPVLVTGIGFCIMLFGQMFADGSNSFIVKEILSYTPFEQGYWVLTMDAGAGTQLKAVIVSIAFIILMLSITYGIFKKAELK